MIDTGPVSRSRNCIEHANIVDLLMEDPLAEWNG